MVHAQYLCRNIDTQINVHTFVLFSLLSLIFSFLAFTPTVVSHYQCTMTGKRRGLATHFTNKRPFADYPAILDMNQLRMPGLLCKLFSSCLDMFQWLNNCSRLDFICPFLDRRIPKPTFSPFFFPKGKEVAFIFNLNSFKAAVLKVCHLPFPVASRGYVFLKWESLYLKTDDFCLVMSDTESMASCFNVTALVRPDMTSNHS